MPLSEKDVEGGPEKKRKKEKKKSIEMTGTVYKPQPFSLGCFKPMSNSQLNPSMSRLVMLHFSEEAIRLAMEERRKLIEEERIRKKKERQEVRDKHVPY